MAFSIGASNFPTLTAQPFGYDEADTRAGRTARKWALAGLLQPSEWLALLGVYNTWRDARINDEDSATSGVVGTTVALSGSGPGGQSWTNIPCWFLTAPSAEQSGRYLLVSVELVDAAQALAVLLKEQEAEGGEDVPDFGTYLLGTTTLTLTKPIDSYAGGPSVESTAAGGSYISGPLLATRVRDIEGTTTESGWSAIRSWYESIVTTIPSNGSYYPITPPSASAEVKVINGVKTTQYTIAIQLIQVR